MDERKELVQKHIDRLIHYGEAYKAAFEELTERFPLEEQIIRGHISVRKPPNESNKRLLAPGGTKAGQNVKALKYA